MTENNNQWPQNAWHSPDEPENAGTPEDAGPTAQNGSDQIPGPGEVISVNSQNAGQVPPPQNGYQSPYEAAYADQGQYVYQGQAPMYSAENGYYAPPTPGYPYNQQAAAAAKKPKSRGWIVGLVAIILLFVLLFAGLASCTSFLNNITSFDSLTSSETTAITTGPTVAVINIDSTIQYDGSTSSPEGLKVQLDIAEADPNIIAVVLRVNSGGGTATAGEEMSEYVKQFSKPIVVSSASMNASAAYEISSQADYIFTDETTEIGAIGTALQVTDLSGLLDNLGINIENITSADSKDSSYGTRALTDEEREYYQAMVDQINDTFIARVAEGRGMTIEEVTELATGLTFTGIDAVENGLADEIGLLEDAVAKASELAGVDPDTISTVTLDSSSTDLTDLLDLLGEDDTLIDELAAYLKEN